MSKKLAKAINVFYSYAPQDEQLLKELEKHLTVLKQEALITSWYSHKIMAGAERAHEIDTHLNTAQIILFLISADFLALNYRDGTEVRQALRRQSNGAVVIPIILRPVDWNIVPFSKLQALPTNGKAITSWSGRHGRDKAFTEVSIGIRSVIKKIQEDEADKLRQHGKQTTSKAFISNNAIEKVWLYRADVFYGYERYEEALIVYEQVLRLHSNDSVAYIGKGDSLYMLERYREALVVYEQAIHLDPNDPVAHTGRGNTLWKLNRGWGAIDAYEQAIHLDPTNADIYYYKGNAHFILRRYEDAIVAYKQAILLSFTGVEVYLRKGEAHSYLHQYEEALVDYEQAIHLSPNTIDLYVAKGSILHQLERYEEAAACLKEHNALIKRYEEAIEANKCPFCQVEMRPGDSFCLNCGNRLLRSSQPALHNRFQSLKQQPIPTDKCPVCQAGIRPGDSFCLNCGNRL